MLGLKPPLWWISYIISAKIGLKAVYSIRFRAIPTGIRVPVILAGKHCHYWDVPLLASVSRRCVGKSPFFEMGTFQGYPILGRVTWLLRAIGGFPVMRSKDVLRLKHQTGKSRAELSKVMREINEAAADKRREILRRGQALCFFPEGTRDPDGIGRLRARQEVDEAIAQDEAEGLGIQLVPVFPVFGPKPSFPIPFIRRTPVDVIILDPISLKGRETTELLEEVASLMREHWRPQ